MKAFHKVLCVPVLTLFLLLLPQAGFAHGEWKVGDAVIKDVWARASKVRNGAAYLTIVNHGKVPIRLVGVSSPVARRAQLHTTIMADGVMKMRPVKAIEVAPGETVILKPGGYHIMLMGLRQPLEVDDHFDLTLQFEGHDPVPVVVHVRPSGAMKMKMD